MFKYPLVTKQTGEEGQKVSKVLVQEAADIAREIYLGMVLDRAVGVPVLMACAEGGVEIEEVAARSRRRRSSRCRSIPELGLQPFQARRLAYDLGFTGRAGAAGREDHDARCARSSWTRTAAWPRSTRWS